MDGIHANNLFQASAFSKGYHGKCAEGWFAWNMCKYFVRMSFKFGKAGLYVSDNVMHCLYYAFIGGAVVLDRGGSTFWIYSMTTSFFYLLLTNRLISFLEWL